jgi:hypothetical protein
MENALTLFYILINIIENATILITRKYGRYFRAGVKGFARTDDNQGEALGTTIILREQTSSSCVGNFSLKLEKYLLICASRITKNK